MYLYTFPNPPTPITSSSCNSSKSISIGWTLSITDETRSMLSASATKFAGKIPTFPRIFPVHHPSSPEILASLDKTYISENNCVL